MNGPPDDRPASAPVEPGASAPPSAIVRALNKQATIRATLESLRAQTVDVEIVLVDSGSTDDTLAVARPLVDEIVRIPAADFSYGGALNTGARHAGGSILFALSAHCVAPDAQWVERSISHYDDPQVAGTCGWDRSATGQSVEKSRPMTFADIRQDPHSGFSNQASSWRRSAWADHPFDEQLDACEDKEWQLQVMLAGWKVITDPSLAVQSTHRRAAGLKALWGREFREHRAVAELLPYELKSPSQVVRSWWSDFPWPSERPNWQRRLSPARTVEIFGGYLGDRAGRSRRGPRTVLLPESDSESRCAL